MSPTKSLPSTPSYYKCLCSGIRWNPTLAFTAKLITSYCPFAPQACELLRTRILIHLCTLHRLFLLPSPHPLQELPSPPRKGYGFSTLLLTLREKAVTRKEERRERETISNLQYKRFSVFNRVTLRK